MIAAALLLLAQTGAPLSVEVRESEGFHWCTVRADGAPIERVVDALAARTGRTVEGFAGTPRAALVNVDLQDRPLREVLEVTLGSVGLRAEVRPSVVRVLPLERADMTTEDLEDEAVALYFGATSRFPDHAGVVEARLAQAGISERRGNDRAALDHYLTLIEGFRNSPRVPTARLAAAQLLERTGDWDRAADQYRAVADRRDAESLHATARLGLARCQIESGHEELALILLDALEVGYPTRTAAEGVERELVRARGQNAAGRPLEALTALERADRLGLPRDLVARSMRLRAVAFQALDRLADASRARLVAARESGDADRAAADFALAAELALAAGDELAVLFVAAEAAAHDPPVDLSEHSIAARRALGLPLAVDPAVDPPELVLERAATDLAAGRTTDALALLNALGARRAELSPDQAVRLATTRARALLAVDGLDPALACLRAERRVTPDPERRRALDLTAAELLESRRAFDRAVEAYGGRY